MKAHCAKIHKVDKTGIVYYYSPILTRQHVSPDLLRALFLAFSLGSLF